MLKSSVTVPTTLTIWLVAFFKAVRLFTCKGLSHFAASKSPQTLVGSSPVLRTLLTGYIIMTSNPTNIEAWLTSSCWIGRCLRIPRTGRLYCRQFCILVTYVKRVLAPETGFWHCLADISVKFDHRPLVHRATLIRRLKILVAEFFVRLSDRQTKCPHRSGEYLTGSYHQRVLYQRWFSLRPEINFDGIQSTTCCFSDGMLSSSGISSN